MTLFLPTLATKASHGIEQATAGSGSSPVGEIKQRTMSWPLSLDSVVDKEVVRRKWTLRA